MATAILTPYIENSSARDAHLALKQAVKTMAQAKHCAVIWFQEIVARKLYKELGYASIYLYADQELGFSASKTTNYLKLSKTLVGLPQLKKELAEGEIGYTKACEIIKVANPKNVGDWLKEARNTPRRELVKKVAKARKNAEIQQKSNSSQIQLLPPRKITVPEVAIKHRIALEMSSEQYARYESLREKLLKLGAVPPGVSSEDLLLAGLAALAESNTESETRSTSPVQIHVHKCLECEKTTLSSKGREVLLTEVEYDRLSCDANIKTPGKPNRASIKPSIKREVLRRDQHRCQAPGCGNTWFLEVHHITPRRLGGTNSQGNLITLCSACHSYWHERGRRNFSLPGENIHYPKE